MRSHHYILTPAQVQQHAREHLQAFIPLADFSDKCTATVLWTVLLAAAGTISSIFATCNRLCRAPSVETIRKALLATLPESDKLHRQINRALAGDLPKGLKRSARPVACDLHLTPYYGQPFADPKELYRSHAKDGTTHFHRYATAYVVCKGQRFTLALTHVLQGEPVKEVLQRLLQQVRRAGVRITYVLLDRGFYNVAVIRYLQAARTPFLMPAKFTGRKPKNWNVPENFRAWKRSGWGQYTLTHSDRKGKVLRRATVDICVVCRNLACRRRRRGGPPRKRGRQRWIYALWGLGKRTCAWVREAYRQRFAIETTYRQLNEGRIRTCTRRPEVRLLFIALALLLRNVWVWLHYEVLASRRRGPRQLNLERLRLRKLLLWLVHVAETNFGVASYVPAEVPL